MTPDEWKSLGLVFGCEGYRMFMEGEFRTFEVTPEHRVVGTFSFALGSSFNLGKFRTQEQADAVALTLRITNPR